MGDKTKIEWTDMSWNPVVGCSVVSPGCTNCYAMSLAGTRLKEVPSYQGLTTATKAGPVWNGTVRFVPGALAQPLRKQRPRMIFVNSMSDLFHDEVKIDWIDQIFAIMAMAPQHRFQILTKRAENMRRYLSDPNVMIRWMEAAKELAPVVPKGTMFQLKEPLPNVWLGVSAEDQQRANERIPDLLETPAAVRFVSCEPLLGSVDLTQIRHPQPYMINALKGWHQWDDNTVRRLDWVIVGGESGPNARPMHPQWARDIRDQCEDHCTPFHFKQWGEFVSVSEVEGPGRHHTFPDGATVRRIGKSNAGRTLDGRRHDGYPGAPA